MGGMMDGYATPSAADPKQYRFDYIRRRIRAQIYAAETGLVGPDGFQRYLAKAKQQEAAAAAPMNAVAAAGSGEGPEGRRPAAGSRGARQGSSRKGLHRQGD